MGLMVWRRLRCTSATNFPNLPLPNVKWVLVIEHHCEVSQLSICYKFIFHRLCQPTPTHSTLHLVNPLLNVQTFQIHWDQVNEISVSEMPPNICACLTLMYNKSFISKSHGSYGIVFGYVSHRQFEVHAKKKLWRQRSTSREKNQGDDTQ